ncbi:hypothetical protein AB0M57_26005 [Streptomyces sp. NPDC051597]|uniref:hypothetical protein n=1 Tax=Streptomyces sp. NPDC051597 TaxID=3155049 RepID=UPI003419E772
MNGGPPARVNGEQPLTDSTEPGDPAQYRPCEVCHEPGADTVVRLFVADGTGGARSSYAHRGCAGASEAGVSTPC